MQTASSSIWPRIAELTFNSDKRYMTKIPYRIEYLNQNKICLK